MFLQSSSCLFFQLFCSRCLHMCFQHDTFTTLLKLVFFENATSGNWVFQILLIVGRDIDGKLSSWRASLISFNKELWLYVDGSNLKEADLPSSSTCRVWFGEKFELSITILCNIYMVATVCAHGLNLLVLPWIPLTCPCWKLCW